jgi:hypothetical protein
MMNDEPGNYEFRTANAEPRLANFDIRNSTFELRDIRRALIEADLEMSSDELRTPNRASPTSTFEILPSNFAPLPGQLFYSTQIPVCLWFLAKNKAADAKRGFRDRRVVENVLSLAA